MTSQETSDCNIEKYREELHSAQISWQSEIQWNNSNISADQEKAIWMSMPIYNTDKSLNSTLFYYYDSKYGNEQG